MKNNELDYICFLMDRHIYKQGYSSSTVILSASFGISRYLHIMYTVLPVCCMQQLLKQ